MELVKEDERLDDLQYQDMMLIQNPNGYCFTSDAVLLANFIKGNPKEKMLEICAGSGVITMLATKKNGIKSASCLELQSELADRARRSVLYNSQEDVITVIEGDVRNIKKIFSAGSFDIVCCNPPYYRTDEGEMRGSEETQIARNEISLTLLQCLEGIGYALKYGGRCYFVYRADRMAELLELMRENKLEPKKIVIISPKEDKKADTLLVECKKNGSSGCKVISLLRDKIDLSTLKDIL